MKKILVLGAGRSASTAIKYLLDAAKKSDWEVTVADYSVALARQKVGGHKRGRAILFDVFDGSERARLVEEADLVVSFLPHTMHVMVAQDCIRFDTHLVTASYVSEEMKALHELAERKGVLLLNECGVDPGLDHMSAMKDIHRIKEMGGKIESFKSYAGALVAPKSSNIWGYKFTWAPRNVVLAGAGGPAIYLKNNRIKYIPYTRLFRQTETIEVPGYGDFEAYANRNSIKYRIPYSLKSTPTIWRATLRKPGFCAAWDALVRIGLTDNSYKIRGSGEMTWTDLMLSYIPDCPGKTPEECLAQFLGLEMNDPVMEKLLWLDLFSDEPALPDNGTPVEILERKLMEKWKFGEKDTDMVVMQHQFVYSVKGKRMQKIASLVAKGENQVHSAVSRTVGLPAAISAKLILQDKITLRGVQIPTEKEIYGPVLDELEDFDIRFEEQEFELNGEAEVPA